MATTTSALQKEREHTEAIRKHLLALREAMLARTKVSAASLLDVNTDWRVRARLAATTTALDQNSEYLGGREGVLAPLVRVIDVSLRRRIELLKRLADPEMATPRPGKRVEIADLSSDEEDSGGDV